MKAYSLVVNECIHICPKVGIYCIKLWIDDQAQNVSSRGSGPGRCVVKSLNFPKDIINQRKMHWFPDQVLV
jgi:hypothetical protein